MAAITTLEELTAALKDQHEQLQGLLLRVLNEKGEERANLFAKVRQVIAAHEALEQGTVHPATRQAEDESVADSRVDEESKAEEAITKLESLEVDSEKFENGFERLSRDVAQHAENEEHEEFGELSGELTDVAAARVATGLELVEQAKEGSLGGDAFEDLFNGCKRRIADAG
ncbi:MAG: hemerythrin domain-containing protein [Marmoricola sp.]